MAVACRVAVSLLGAVRLNESMGESSEQTSYTLGNPSELLPGWHCCHPGVSGWLQVGEVVWGLEVEKEGPRAPC